MRRAAAETQQMREMLAERDEKIRRLERLADEYRSQLDLLRTQVSVLCCVILTTSTKEVMFSLLSVCLSWRRSIVGRTLVSAGELSLSCARLLAGRVTALWLRRPLPVSQHGQLSLPYLRGRLMSSNPC